MSQIFQVLGALLILIPFAWSTLGALETSSPFYLWSNLAGGTALGVTAVIGQQWGFVLLESAWTLVAAARLINRAGFRGEPRES
jgi:hypothetical protein